MTENFNNAFKTILEERLKVPESYSKEEIIAQILDFGTDQDDVEDLLATTCTLYLSGDGVELIQGYTNEIDNQKEFAQKLDSTQTSPNKKNQYRMSLSEAESLSSKFERALNEEKRLERIARKLEDSHLLSKVKFEKKQMEEAGEKLSKLVEKKENLEELIERYESLETHVESYEIAKSLEQRKAVLQIVLDNYVEASKRDSGKFKVFLPEKFRDKLMSNADIYNEEIAGFFICRKVGRDYTALKMILTGIGDEQNVDPNSTKYDALRELLNKYQKYDYVDFHTHSRGTIDKYGDKFGQGWSERDRENIRSKSDGYIGMLFTPETVKIKGNSIDTEYIFIDSESSNEFEGWKDQVEEDWSEVAESYTFENLPEQTEFTG